MGSLEAVIAPEDLRSRIITELDEATDRLKGGATAGE